MPLILLLRYGRVPWGILYSKLLYFAVQKLP